jgi:ABC-type phosphate transport system substrate-binding protein
MFRSLFSRRGAVALAAASIGAASLSLAAAGTAGASVPNASLILGSGSQTSYALMTSLTDLFNGSPGCDLTASTSLPLALNCGTTPTTAGTAGGEQGFDVAAENPYNDYSVQAPAVGSGNGATQLIDAGAGSPTTSPVISYSRASAHKGNTTDNDVQYATDGVSWSTFAKTSAGATAQAKITTLTMSQLSSIWLGTVSCTVKGVAYSMNWICLGAKSASPIDVYVAQTGSGTYSTWSGAMGFTGATPAGVTCSTCEAGWPTSGTDPQTGLPYASDSAAQHSNIFENQMSTISTRPDAADAIYFFSFGRFTDTCPGYKFKKNTYTAVCAGTPKTDTTLLGAINGIPATKANIQGTGGGGGVTFPVTRGLYNLYNNSSASVPSSQATLNFVSEKGFLCKPSTTTDIDPQTGVAYRTEIESAITANGFFPLDVSGAPFAQGTVTSPAIITDSAYTAVDGGGTNGFCLVTNG